MRFYTFLYTVEGYYIAVHYFSTFVNAGLFFVDGAGLTAAMYMTTLSFFLSSRLGPLSKLRVHVGISLKAS